MGNGCPFWDASCAHLVTVRSIVGLAGGVYTKYCVVITQQNGESFRDILIHSRERAGA